MDDTGLDTLNFRAAALACPCREILLKDPYLISRGTLWAQLEGGNVEA